MWAPIIQSGDLDRDCGSRLWLGPTLTIATIWKMNQQMQDLFFVSPHLSVILSFKYKDEVFKKKNCYTGY